MRTATVSRSRVLLLLPLLALAGACDPMAEDPVYLYGRALHPDGSAWAGAQLTLESRIPAPYRQEGPGPTPPFAAHATGMTEASGDVTFQSTDGYLHPYRSSSPTASMQPEFRLALAGPDGGGASLFFGWSGGDAELPDLRPWVAGLRVEPHPEGLQLAFAPPPGPVPYPPTMQVPWSRDQDGNFEEHSPPRPWAVVQVWQGEHLAWKQQVQLDASGGAGELGRLRAEVWDEAEGLSAQVRVATDGAWFFQPLVGRSSHTRWRMDWRTPQVALPSGSMRPPSRGAACLGESAGAPCPWTDGRFAPVQVPAGAEVGVTLAAPTRLTRMVVRGLDLSPYRSTPWVLLVEGSTDAVSWGQLARLTLTPYAFSLEDGMGATGMLLSSVETPWDPGLSVLGEGAGFFAAPLAPDAPAVQHVRLRLESAPGSGSPAVIEGLAELTLR